MVTHLLSPQAIDVAVKVLRPSQSNQNVDPFYRQQAWHVLQVSNSL